MRIGLIPCSDPFHGGSFQYSLSLLRAVNTISLTNYRDEYTLFVRSARGGRNFKAYWNGSHCNFPLLSKERFLDAVEGRIRPYCLRQRLKQIALLLRPTRFKNSDCPSQNTKLHSFLAQHKTDWVLYTTPTTLSFEAGIPYVTPIYDLQHRLQPEFEEVSAHGQWDRREYLYRNGARHATLILADSDIGKEDILNFYGQYGVTEDRVKVLQYVPAPYLLSEVSSEERRRVREMYRLPDRYFFYPAQFWPHKNHFRVVQAMGLLKEDKGTKVHVVLCGSYSGSDRTRVFNDVMREAHRLTVNKQIHFLGYVPNDVMSALYAEALSLLMPTFFGPTNIPIVEAWQFGCPVLASTIRGIREQVGKAGLLVDPRSVEAIADGMWRLWEDASLRGDLAKRGAIKVAQYNQQDFRARVVEIIEEAIMRVRENKSLPLLSRQKFATAFT